MSQLRRINSMPDPVRKQVASVRRTEFIELRNRQRDLLKQIEAQAIENRSLKLVRAKFDTALTKYTGANSEIAVTHDSHRSEMQQLRKELCISNRRCQKFDQKIRTTEYELNKVKDLLRRYRELIDKEGREGAETLAERLRQNEESIREKDLDIQNLRTEIECLTMSQQEEIKSEKLQNRQAKKDVRDLKKELEATVTRLKETSKEVDLKSIRYFQKSSTSVGPLQSKSEKPHLQTFASQGQSEALVSSRQRAKVYAANRQCRTRKKRKEYQQVTEIDFTVHD